MDTVSLHHIPRPPTGRGQFDSCHAYFIFTSCKNILQLSEQSHKHWKFPVDQYRLHGNAKLILKYLIIVQVNMIECVTKQQYASNLF